MLKIRETKSFINCLIFIEASYRQTKETAARDHLRYRTTAAPCRFWAGPGLPGRGRGRPQLPAASSRFLERGSSSLALRGVPAPSSSKAPGPAPLKAAPPDCPHRPYSRRYSPSSPLRCPSPHSISFPIFSALTSQSPGLSSPPPPFQPLPPFISIFALLHLFPLLLLLFPKCRLDASTFW